MTRRPSEEAVLFLLFGLLRSGQIKLRRIVGCQELKAGGEPAELPNKLLLNPPNLVIVGTIA